MRIFEEPTAPPEGDDFWSNLPEWLTDAGATLLGVATIILACVVAAWILRLVIRRVVKHIVLGAKSKANVDDTQALDRSPLAAVRVVQRTRTLGTILQGVVNVTLFFVALLLIVQLLNPDILGSLTLLTAAIGAGLGFGAQNIVRDVLNGIFIVAGDQLGIGDVVDLGLATGVVEYVSVRITHIRDVNGTLWYVRNGEILRIGNMSMGWARVIIDLSVSHGTDIDAVENTMMDAATDLMKDPKWRSRIVERPELWGLETTGSDVHVLRIVMRTRSNAKDDVSQELRIRLMKAVTKMGVDVPALAAVELSGREGAQRVRGANPPKTRPTPTMAGLTGPKARPTWRARKVPSPLPLIDETSPAPTPRPTPSASDSSAEAPEDMHKPHGPEPDDTQHQQDGTL